MIEDKEKLRSDIDKFLSTAPRYYKSGSELTVPLEWFSDVTRLLARASGYLKILPDNVNHYIDSEIKLFHFLASFNGSIEKNRERLKYHGCCCYFCLHYFEYLDIVWERSGKVALCPNCETDTVLPRIIKYNDEDELVSLTVGRELLMDMKKYWFF